MCGIAGFLERGGEARGAADELERCARDMAERLRHRGPDDGGVWVDADAGLALGHRRLSVLDLSSAGHQPMLSHSGRHVLVFNGEVYNHHELRARLGSVPWRGTSDTETLLAGIEAWGLERTLEHVVGMFALAVWDRTERVLRLARDRMGEKPLYYGWQGNAFLFGSELKALRAHPTFTGDIDPAGLALLLRHGYIRAPHSIHRSIRKLEPGTVLTLGGDAPVGSVPAPRPYWSLDEIADRARTAPFRGDDGDAADRLEAVLSEAVRLQLISDVPLGALLSGGIDSSLVVALMQRHSTRPVRTFTIGFRERGFDEAKHAARVAQHLGTEHHELYVSAGDALDVIPHLPSIYDEPLGDPSQIPTTIIARLARSAVTVVLSGDGGDELFGGYDRYLREPARWRRLSAVPVSVRRWTAAAAWASARGLTHVRPFETAANRSRAFASVAAAPDLPAYYVARLSQWAAEDGVMASGGGTGGHEIGGRNGAGGGGAVDFMMRYDARTFLPDDVLCKVDRAAMAASLETRAPLLDHRVVELALSLPVGMKIRNGQGKWILRSLLHRMVPPALVDRPKMGFGIPLGEWLRGPLRDWAEALLSERRLREQGHVSPAVVRKRWTQHLAGLGYWEQSLWSILSFQAWLDAP
jgi:asparagine synthase (glutamine-hydrolysing)